MKKKILYLIPLVIIGILLGIVFNNTTVTKTQLSYLDIKLASYPDVQDNDNNVEGTDNVKFDAYFVIDGNKKRGNYLRYDKAATLYIDFNISGGAELKNAYIQFDNKNVYLSSAYSGSNYLSLSNVSSGTNRFYKINVTSDMGVDISKYSGVNKAILKGTLVEDGIEKEITKEVEYQVDWYRDKFVSSVYGNSSLSVVDDKIVAEYNITAKSREAKLMKALRLQMSVSTLNDYNPTSVTVTGTNINYNYDPQTNIITAYREAELEGTVIENSAYDYIDYDEKFINNIKVVVEYPIDAGYQDAIIPLTVEEYGELYNTSDFSQFITSSKSSTTIIAKAVVAEVIEELHESGPVPYLVGVRSTVSSLNKYSRLLDSRYIEKTPALQLHDGKEADKTTTYKYKISTDVYHTMGTIENVIIRDNYDMFDTYDTMENVYRYKSIEFITPEYRLGYNGYIKLINEETDELIHIFTRDDWDNIYTFETDVRKIRLETSPLYGISSTTCRSEYECELHFKNALTTVITKEIDNEAMVSNYTKAQIEGFDNIITSFNTVLNAKNVENHPNAVSSNSYDRILYVASQSSTINLYTLKQDSTIEGVYNYNLLLSVGKTDEIVKGWVNGEFLIVIPNKIIDININNLSINNDNVKIVGYELSHDRNNSYIKIITSNDNPESYSLTVNCDLLPDPREDGNIYIELYGLNRDFYPSESATADRYDLNNDGNTYDIINYDTSRITINTSDEVKTLTLVRVYDENNEENVFVTPNVAEVDPTKYQNNARVEMILLNNTSDSLQDIRIVGKVGYIGNTYQLRNVDLESMFNLYMNNTGIGGSITSDKYVVYYSDQEQPTQDINDVNNNWTLKDDVVDFNTIKSFMVVVNNTLLGNSNLTFSYNINMPLDTEYLNKVSYVTHAVYYNRNSITGLIADSPIEQRKTGLSMVRKYDAVIYDYKIATNRTISGSTYIITDEDGKQKVVSTNSSGVASISGLYTNKKYKIKQIYIEYPYVIDEEEKEFEIINNDSDVLVLGDNTGIYRNIDYQNGTLSISLNNDVRYSLNLKNTDLDTNEDISYAKFKITGKGYEDGIVLTTNDLGELNLGGLYLYEDYTIEQISSPGHLDLTTPIVIHLVRDRNGNVRIGKKEVIKDTISSVTTTGGDGFYVSRMQLSAKTRYTNGGVDEGYFEVDLSDNVGNYKIEYTTYKDSNDSWTEGYKSKVIVIADSSSHIPSVDPVEVEQTFSFVTPYIYNTIDTAYLYDSSTNSYTQVPITGGRKYYVYVYASHGNSTRYGYVTIEFNPIKLINGDTEEYVPINETVNVQHEFVNNVYQTIVDSTSIDSPSFSVNVKSKKAPTFNLELTKLSADTHEPLKNAQYKITGSGVPASGYYIKTDDNGKATIELREEWKLSANIGNTANYPTTINNLDYNKVLGDYTIREVTPPAGYQIDNREIEFSKVKLFETTDCTSIYNSTNYSYVYNCNVDGNTSYTNSLDYKNFDNQFVNYEFDDATNTLKVTMYDYPLVTVVKKDGENGNILPGTLFAIYSVSYDSYGNEVLDYARDSKNFIIGTKTIINNQDYYVIATDDEGKFNLDLTSGEYKILEVQAIDEKYQIDENGYYFNVGPTREYEEGFSFDFSFNLPYYKNALSRILWDDVITTTDGGFLGSRGDGDVYTHDGVIVEKYDKYGNLEWNYKTARIPYQNNYVYTYYDKESIKVYSDEPGYVPSNTRNMSLAETVDGYIINYYGEGFVKLDKNGNNQWFSSDTNQSHSYYYTYTAACSKSTGRFVDLTDELSDLSEYGNRLAYDPNDPYMQRDEDTYYCYRKTIYDYFTGEFRAGRGDSYYDYNRYLNYQATNAATDSEGNVFIVPYNMSSGLSSDATYILANGEMKDFTFSGSNQSQLKGQYCRRASVVENDPGHPEHGTHIEYSYDTSYCPKYDVFNVFDGFSNEIIDEMIGRGVFGTNQIVRYDKDGNITGVNDLGLYYQIAMNEYNTTNGTNYNYRKTSFNYSGDIIFQRLYVFENDDLLVFSVDNGALRLRYDKEHSKYSIIYYIPPTLYGFTPNYRGNDEVRITGNTFHYADYDINTSSVNNIYNIGENGELLSIVHPITDELTPTLGSFAGSYASYYKMSDDKYIIIISNNYAYNDYSTTPVTLADGTIVNIDLNRTPDGKRIGRLYIYECDAQGNINWIKTYSNITSDDSSNYWATPMLNPRLSIDRNKLLLPINALENSTMTNDSTGKEYSIKGNMFVFNTAEEVRPEAPEQYSLEIMNNRKIFNININSGENGITEIINGNNIVNALSNEEKSIENIKYGDDSIYTIKPKGNAGYLLDKVLLDDEPYPYTVLEDGTIVLDKFTNVTENKNLTITFKPGDAMVIVHHYLKDTTNRIASDEIISGLTNAPYETEPAVNPLYILTKDENDEFVLPDNMTGFFAADPITVIYYYEENLVNLKVNYYIKNTTIELSPSETTQQKLGSTYKTSKKDIIGYDVVNVIGNEEGTLNSLMTEVTYMYQSVDQTTIKIRYIDKDTGKDINNPIIKIVNRNSEYETTTIDIDGYEYFDRTPNYKGIADTEEIEVIYYYVKPEVKGEEENPKTGDNITNILKLLSISIIGLTTVILYKRNEKLFTNK